MDVNLQLQVHVLASAFVRAMSPAPIFGTRFPTSQFPHKWKALHKTEIMNNKEKHILSRYAMKSPAESFAEMHREIVEKGVEIVKMRWPKCIHYFQLKGLL